MALLDMVQQHLGQNEVTQISQQLGVDPSTAQRAINAALPMIMGGMAGHASSPEGAATIQQAATAHQDAPEMLGNILQTGGAADAGASGGLLGRIFGAHNETVQQSVQQATGLEPDKTRKLLMMLAPVVLGMLARHQFGGQQASTNPGQIAGTLQQEARTAQQKAPNLGGMLGQILGGFGG